MQYTAGAATTAGDHPPIHGLTRPFDHGEGTESGGVKTDPGWVHFPDATILQLDGEMSRWLVDWARRRVRI